jgi:hypothetical protein
MTFQIRPKMASNDSLPGRAEVAARRARIAVVASALAISLGSVWYPAPAALSSAQSALDTRVRRLQDEEQIRELLEEYGHTFDTRDLDGYSRLFARKGTWNGNFGGSYVTSTGPAEVLAMMVRVLGKPQYDPNKVAGLHLMTNFFIHVDGDLATAQSKWTFFGRSKDNKLVPSLAGHYDDKLIREDGQWRFLERRVARDIPNEE